MWYHDDNMQWFRIRCKGISNKYFEPETESDSVPDSESEWYSNTFQSVLRAAASQLFPDYNNNSTIFENRTTFTLEILCNFGFVSNQMFPFLSEAVLKKRPTAVSANPVFFVQVKANMFDRRVAASLPDNLQHTDSRGQWRRSRERSFHIKNSIFTSRSQKSHTCRSALSIPKPYATQAGPWRDQF